LSEESKKEIKETPMPETPERHTGIVQFFDNKKGWGFIRFEEKDYFVHWKDIIGTAGFKTLLENEEITFEIDYDKQGRTRAINVRRDKAEMLYKRSRRTVSTAGEEEKE